MSIDAIVNALDARPTGRDRWRAACPVCGGANRSTLSIGVGDSSAVLLKCWKSGCDAEQIAQAAGLQIADLFPPRESCGKPAKRRRMLAATQALDLLQRETLVVFVVACDMQQRRAISSADFDRLGAAVSRIQALGAEVYA